MLRFNGLVSYYVLAYLRNYLQLKVRVQAVVVEGSKILLL